MALEDKEIMVETDELEPLTESEKEEEQEEEKAEDEPDPVQDPDVDPMKELELEEDDKGQEETEKEEREEGEPAPKAQLSREGSLSLKSPSEEERSATRTLIRQPSPVVETSDGEEHDQVYFVYDIPKYFLLGDNHSVIGLERKHVSLAINQ